MQNARQPSSSQPRNEWRSATSSAQNIDSNTHGVSSPETTDRVFPIRSVVSVDPTPTPGARPDTGGYFYTPGRANDSRRRSETTESETSTHRPDLPDGLDSKETIREQPRIEEKEDREGSREREKTGGVNQASNRRQQASRLPTEIFSDIRSNDTTSERPPGPPTSLGPASSVTSGKSSVEEGGILTARFKHVISEDGHAVITGRDGETLQRCEDEPIHIPGAVQAFGLLIALYEESEGKLIVRIVSENAKRIIGYTPQQLFALDSFTDIFSEDQADNLLDHIDFIREDDADIATNGPEVFTMSIRTPHRKSVKLWCAIHQNDSNPDIIICEFELEDDQEYPLVPLNSRTPELPEDTLDSDPTPEEYAESTHNTSRPLRVLRSARKRKGEAAAMEVFNIMSQVQEQLAEAPTLEKFLKVLVGVVKELTGFHR
ncbi:hypothetical protein LTS18_003619, partial [Coniosporium uncinatum]